MSSVFTRLILHIIPRPVCFGQSQDAWIAASSLHVAIPMHVKRLDVGESPVTCGAMRSACLSCPRVIASSTCRLHLTSLLFLPREFLTRTHDRFILPTIAPNVRTLPNLTARHFTPIVLLVHAQQSPFMIVIANINSSSHGASYPQLQQSFSFFLF